MKYPVCVSVNGQDVRAEVEARTLLVDFLREHAGLRRLRAACAAGTCGGCVVLLDGVAVKSCACLAVGADGCRVSVPQGASPCGAVSGTEPFPPADPLWVAIVRSELPRARLGAIDLSAARSMPGVLGAFTCAEIRGVCGPLEAVGPGGQEIHGPPLYPLAEGEATYAGQPVAAVVALSREAARDAAETVRVEYDALTPVTDLKAASADDAPRAHAGLDTAVTFDESAQEGSVDEIFARADRVFEQSFRAGRRPPDAAGPCVAAARFAPESGELTLWSCTRTPHVLRGRLSRALHLPENSVRVVSADLPGHSRLPLGFPAEEALVGALARIHAPRPVLWLEDEPPGAAAGPRGCGESADVAVAVRRDGRLLALRCDVVLDAGAFPQLSGMRQPADTFEAAVRIYALEAWRLSARGVITNSVAAPGAGDLTAWISCVLECMVETVAAALELDPVEVRRVNLRRPADGSADPAELLGRVVKKAGLPALRDERRKRRARGDLCGIGTVVAADVFTPRAERWESARVRVLPSGSVEVFPSACPGESGLDEAYRTIAASVLGVSPGDVRIYRGDSAWGPPGTGWPAGRGILVGGAAVHDAARRVEAKMRRVAAIILGVAEDYVQHANREFLAGDATVSFAEVCLYAYRAEGLPPGEPPGLEETCVARPEAPSVSQGAQVCAVSIDRGTGEVHVLRHAAVYDLGKVVHEPSAGERVERGVAQGLERAFCHRARDDGDSFLTSAAVRARTPAGMPRVPPLDREFLAAPGPARPPGARGAGAVAEACSLAAAVCAVQDALRLEGIPHVDLPLSPANILRALADGGDRGAGGAR